MDLEVERTAVIDDEDKAQRLARAICADVMLYNGAAKDAPRDQRRALIAAPVQEGRALFASRASPRLAHVFEEAVAELVSGPLGIEAPGAGARVASPARAPTSIDPPSPEGSSSNKLVIVVAVLLVIAAAVAFLAVK